VPTGRSEFNKAFKRVLNTAALPLHFTPHGLRHTYASLLLQQGASPAYVQRQLGHASIQLTVDTYGKWLPIGNKAAVDGLDTPAAVAAIACGASSGRSGPRRTSTTSKDECLRPTVVTQPAQRAQRQAVVFPCDELARRRHA